MVFAYTTYRKDSHPHVIGRGSVFPLEISSIRIRAAKSDYLTFKSDDSGEYDYNDLASMIWRSPAKIPSIWIYDTQEASPEYLALLISILNKADGLTIYNSLGGDAAYGCFMGSMLQQNGLRELHVKFSDNIFMSTYQAKLLFEGIASSQCLEKLDLTGNFSEPAEAGTALAKALKRNHSLETLELRLNVEDGGTEVRELFQAAIADRRMHKFSMLRRKGDQQLSFDVMAEVLCTDKCTVKTLEIIGFETTARAQSALSNEHIETLKNTSVTCYWLQETDSLDSIRIMETVSLFRSIKELWLCDNRISNLSPLDPLLVGNSLTLETLDLMGNRIGEKDAVEFFRKMPKMTCLKKVYLADNPFIKSSEIWKDVLSVAAWQNRSLECISCVDYVYEDDEFAEMNIPLSLNRGGRRALEIESSTPLPYNLWPHVLERAGKLSYCRVSDDVSDPPSLDSTRPDVVFWLLKEKMLGNCLGNVPV